MLSKSKILANLCYTPLVYTRINKKLESNFAKEKIEKMLFDIIEKTEEINFQKIGKNFYITNIEENIKITINSNTYRVITVNVLRKN